MKSKIENIKKLFNEQIEENKIFSLKLEQIKNDKTYSSQIKSELIETVKNGYKEKSNLKRDEIIKAVEELRNAEKTVLDLSDSRLNNAINLVCTLGDKMPTHILRAIENEFRGNQAGLEALKGAYQKAGLETFRIEKNIYDVDTTYRNLAQYIYDSFRKPEKITKLDQPLLTLKMIEDVCEPEPTEAVELQVNTIPKII